jgi:transcriptional regulator with XRE-family HTH domain
LTYTSIQCSIFLFIDVYINILIMETLLEIGQAIAARRKQLKMKQKAVAAAADISAESLSRLERGQVAEFGARKLLNVLAVLEAEIEFIARRQAGHLDALRRERNEAAQATMPALKGSK